VVGMNQNATAASPSPATLCRWAADDMPRETRIIASVRNGLVYVRRVDRIDRDGDIPMCAASEWPGLVERGEIEIVDVVML
jgi:hypothetical protein